MRHEPWIGVSRRQVLYAGGLALAVSAAAARVTPAGSVLRGGGGTASLVGAFHAVVHDAGYAETSRFAGRFLQAGIPGFAIRHDVTSLWLDQLSRGWAPSDPPLVGMTNQASMFMLGQMASRSNRCVLLQLTQGDSQVWRAMPAAVGADTLVRWVIGRPAQCRSVVGHMALVERFPMLVQQA